LQAAILLWSALQSRKAFFTPYRPFAFAVDFLLNVCSVLFAITAYSSAPVLLNLLLILPALVLLLPLNTGSAAQKPTKQPSTKKPKAPSSKDATTSSSPPAIRPFLTNYRGGMMIITCLAILAVDFRVFPRRFAKVENWGTSLMDLGVGSFVFSAGVVSARPLLRSLSAPSDKRSPPFMSRFVASFRHSIPLLILGFIRLYSVKGLDYAEHVTEYGVHWNFFFTLALLPPFVELSDLLTAHLKLRAGTLAIILSLAYEVILNTTSLKAYILVSPRGPSLLSKNREGVFSFTGYLAIFLAARGLGLLLLDTHSSAPKTSQKIGASAFARKERTYLLKTLFFTSTVWVALYLLSTSYWTFSLAVSRRLANLPYVLWVVAFNHAQILLLCLIETVCLPQAFIHDSQKGDEAFGDTSSRVMQAFNKNGLAIFLVANLLTGLVNLTVDTLDMKNVGSMVILIGYAGVVTGLAVGLDALGWKIKL
jgi:glucosaminylphosphatidylinositol acyltransferase